MSIKAELKQGAATAAALRQAKWGSEDLADIAQEFGRSSHQYASQHAITLERIRPHLELLLTAAVIGLGDQNQNDLRQTNRSVTASPKQFPVPEPREDLPRKTPR